MYAIKTTKVYKKALKKLLRSGDFDLKILESVIDKLSSGKTLPKKNRDHKLTGKLHLFRECHVAPDLLLIYYIENKQLVLVLVDIGSRSRLFK